MAKRTLRQYEINVALHEASGAGIVSTTRRCGQDPNWAAMPGPAESSLKALRLRVAALELGRRVNLK
jgi:hypothetical protein